MLSHHVVDQFRDQDRLANPRAAEQPSLVADTLGHYRVLEHIGTGGLGEVYRARDTSLGRTVAVKVLSSDFPTGEAARGELRRDAAAAGTLSHPGIATLFEVGEDRGRTFLVFEYVPGQTLRSLLASGPLNPRLAVDLAIQVADALAGADAHGVPHGDLKPDNVMVTPRGRAKLLDVGMARWTRGGAARRGAARLSPDVSEATLDTVAYMSPEQLRGARVDRRADVFSLGAILFETLTGRSPFRGATGGATRDQVLESTPPAPSLLNPAVSRTLDLIVGRALSKNANGRHESAAALSLALRAAASRLEAQNARRDPVESASPRRSGNRPVVPWLLALAGALVGLVLAALWLAGAL